MTRRHLTDDPEFLTPDGGAWKSETAREFRVGDRVAVMAGIAECPFSCPKGCDWHKNAKQVMEGRIERLRALHVKTTCSSCDASWPYDLFSSMNHPILVNLWGNVGGWFAPSELRLISPAE